MFSVGFLSHKVVEINGPPVPCVQESAQMRTDLHPIQVRMHTQLFFNLLAEKAYILRSLVRLLRAKSHDVIVATLVVLLSDPSPER